MKSKATNREFILIISITIFSIAIITVLYIYTPGKKEEIRAELVKLIAQGTVIGILGLWIKYLFDEASRKIERERVQLEEFRARKQKTEEMLEWTFRQFIRLCREAKNNTYVESRSSATAIFGAIDGYKYDDLVDNWMLYEPSGPAECARGAFNNLMNELREGKDELTTEKRELIRARCSDWISYFNERFFCLASGKEPCNVSEPSDWQVEH